MAIQIINRGTLGDKFLKNLTTKVRDVASQADIEYVNPFESMLNTETSSPEGVVRMMTSNNAREVFTGISALGFLQKTNEGEDYKQDSYVSTFETDFRPTKYTSKVTITEEDIEDRIVNRKLDEAKQLMIAGKMTQVKHSFEIFNQGFTAQASLSDYLTFYGDAKPMFSIAHPLRDSRTSATTDSNASATGIPLTEVNLETARTELREQIGDNGLPLTIASGDLLLMVPTALEKTAVEITGSALKSNTANNDINIYAGGNIDVMSSKWLSSANGGSDTQWFLVDKRFTPVIDMVFRPLRITNYVTDSNKNFNIDISMRHKVGNRDWRGLWGSKGDGAAYAG